VDWTPAPEPRPEQIWFPEPATPRQSLTGTAAPIPFPAGATVSADDQMAA
jgi:hypothetical protein